MHQKKEATKLVQRKEPFLIPIVDKKRKKTKQKKQRKKLENKKETGNGQELEVVIILLPWGETS